jgi:hypothetical protein
VRTHLEYCKGDGRGVATVTSHGTSEERIPLTFAGEAEWPPRSTLPLLRGGRGVVSGDVANEAMSVSISTPTVGTL